MLKIEYQAIHEKQIKEEFHTYINLLRIPLIDYFAIAIQDKVNGRSISLKSNNDFQAAFESMELSKFDPVRQAIWKTETTFFTFDSLDYSDKMGKEVMRYRKKFDIQNGIVLLERHPTYNHSLTLATGYKKFDGIKFMLENKEALKIVFSDLKIFFTSCNCLK